MSRKLTEEEIRLWAKFTADVEKSPTATSLSFTLENIDPKTDRQENPHASNRTPPRAAAVAEASSQTGSSATHDAVADWMAALTANSPTGNMTNRASGSAKQKHATLPNLSTGSGDGVDGNTSRRFRRGKLPIEGTLDLHGYGLLDAQHAFTDFLALAQSRGWRVIRIITGHGIGRNHSNSNTKGSNVKGSGVLREALPKWVNLPENRLRILSFDGTRPQDGGQGAFLILLRK